MSFMEWVTAVLAIWGAVSILVGLCWWLSGRRIFRKRPTQPQISTRAAKAIADFARYDAEMRGRD